MNQKVKLSLFISGVILLFIIIQYQVTSNDSWNTWNLPMSGKVIVIDAGHGGPDGGAVGGEALEKDIALNVVLYLKDYIQENGGLVLLTREEDSDLAAKDTKGYSRRKAEDLKKRLELINESGADVFLTIHLNAIPSPRWRGAQTFYNPHFEESERMAKFIQDEIRRNLENTTRYAKAVNNLYLLKHAKIPGTLVEIGFLSNTHERELLQTDEYQKKMAASIYEGMLRYFTKENTLSQ